MINAMSGIKMRLFAWSNEIFLTIQTKEVALKSLKSMRLRLYKKLLVIGDNTLEKHNRKLGKIVNHV